MISDLENNSAKSMNSGIKFRSNNLDYKLKPNSKFKVESNLSASENRSKTK